MTKAQCSKTGFTPEPWGDNDDGVILGNLDAYKGLAPLVAIVEGYDENGNGTDEAMVNVRIICASVNAFARAASRLGIGAVELAERLEDGGLAELVEAHEELLADIDGLSSDFEICREISGSSPAKRSRAILAKVKEGAG